MSFSVIMPIMIQAVSIKALNLSPLHLLWHSCTSSCCSQHACNVLLPGFSSFFGFYLIISQYWKPIDHQVSTNTYGNQHQIDIFSDLANNIKNEFSFLIFTPTVFTINAQITA